MNTTMQEKCDAIDCKQVAKYWVESLGQNFSACEYHARKEGINIIEEIE